MPAVTFIFGIIDPVDFELGLPASPGAVVSMVMGAPGADGSEGQPYEHIQASSETEWTINHNKGFKPMVQVFGPGGQEVVADVVHVNADQTRIYFNEPSLGFALLR